MKFNIPSPSAFFTDNTGKISREWYLYLLNLFNDAVSGDEEDQYLFLGRESNSSIIETGIRELISMVNTQRSERATIEMLTRRIVELESQIGMIRVYPQPMTVADGRDLQQFMLGSRSWR